MPTRTRKLALYGVIVFVAGSALLHMTVGSAVVTLFPSWRYEPLPEQAVSIISLSQMLREQRPPTPTPPPPPRKIVQKTGMHLAALKFHEIGSARIKVASVAVHVPARRKSNLSITGPAQPKPDLSRAPTATDAVPQTTPSPAPSAAGRTDTGGTQSDLNGTTVWGDDNPPRIVHLQPLEVAAAPSRPARVQVEIGPAGDVLGVKLLQSSGDASVDEQALEAARKSVFAPATVNGLPVHGTIVVEYPAATTRST